MMPQIRCYKHYGFKNGNPWNTSVQFKTNIVDRDTFGFQYRIYCHLHFNVKGAFDFSSMKAVIERPDLWSVRLMEQK